MKSQKESQFKQNRYLAICITAIFVMLFSTDPLMAQNQNLVKENDNRWGFEFSTGTYYATADIGNADLKMGFGFEGTFHYRVVKHTGVYLGWGWKKFGVDQSFAGNNMDFEETGYVYGIPFRNQLAKTRLNYNLRAGGIYNHVEIENKEGDIVSDTGHGLGYQLSAGFEFPLGRSWVLIPSVRYSSLERSYNSGTENFDANMNTLSTQIGFFKRF